MAYVHFSTADRRGVMCFGTCIIISRWKKKVRERARKEGKGISFNGFGYWDWLGC